MSPSIKQKAAIPVFLVTLVLACFAISRSAQTAQPPDIQNVNVFNTPFQRDFDILISPGSNYGSANSVIPQGKTLVVEFVSASGTFPAGEQPGVFGLTSWMNENAQADLLWNFEASNGDRDLFVESQQIRLYAKTGLLIFAFRDLAVGTARIRGHVIGYLVNTP